MEVSDGHASSVDITFERALRNSTHTELFEASPAISGDGISVLAAIAISCFRHVIDSSDQVPCSCQKRQNNSIIRFRLLSSTESYVSIPSVDLGLTLTQSCSSLANWEMLGND